MHKLRLVFILFMAWVSWQNWGFPILADEPKAALPAEVIPQQLVIPSIELNTPIIPVGLGTVVINGQAYPIWNTAQNDVGWHQGTGPPGQVGNTVLAGHSNSGGEIFRHLDELAIGDEIFVVTTRGWHHYRVAKKLILREKGEPYEVRIANARWILPTDDERLTLVTCWPFPANTHRLIVIAYPISLEPTLELAISSPPANLLHPLNPSPTPPTDQDTAMARLRNDVQLQYLIKRYRLKHLIH